MAVRQTAPLIPLIESAASFHAACDRRRRWRAARCVWRHRPAARHEVRGDREALRFFCSQIVLTSPLANLAAPIDDPSTAIDDLLEVENEAKHACRAGFGAKLCVPRAASACAAGQFQGTMRPAEPADAALPQRAQVDHRDCQFSAMMRAAIAGR